MKILSVIIALLSLPMAKVQATSQSIVEIAVGDDRFETLVELLTAAELVDDLSGDGPFTVFAPTDKAFASLPDTLVTYLEGNATALAEVLLYHVLPEKVRSRDIRHGARATTLQGESVLLRTAWYWSWHYFRWLRHIWVDEAYVTQVDVAASNGVIHVIDNVLLPKSIPDDLLETAKASGNLRTLVKAVKAAGLVDVLSEPGTLFTLLAPSDEAFDAVDSAVLHYLFSNTTALEQVLLYHVIAGASVLSTDVAADAPLTVASALGPELTLNVTEEGDVTVNDDEATVVKADVIALNGVAHVIDAVLLPPDLYLPPPTVVDLVANRTDLSLLTEALITYGLEDDLLEGTYTVFAPNNDAMMAIDWTSLSEDQIKETLLYHVVPRYYTAKTLQHYGSVGLLTLSGDYVAVDADSTAVMIDNTALVVEADLGALNGVVHVIDQVLTPPVKCPYHNPLWCWWEGY